MNTEKLHIDHRILVTGACGQIGTELVAALRGHYGSQQVIAADIRPGTTELLSSGPYVQLDVTQKTSVHSVVKTMQVKQVYHLAAILSAKGEADPQAAWHINMQGLLNILDAAREFKLRMFWPSSIAVFGRSSPKFRCPQAAVMEPATAYGISKLAGEQWCKYYFEHHGVDVRSIRYPGLISYTSPPGGGTTDYAVDIFYQALAKRYYHCFLSGDTTLPMLYMPDAIRATLELMDAPSEALSVRTSYNIAGLSFNPQHLAEAIQRHIPGFSLSCEPDFRQKIADSWPDSIDDSTAYQDWGWKHRYDLPAMVASMLENINLKTYA